MVNYNNTMMPTLESWWVWSWPSTSVLCPEGWWGCPGCWTPPLSGNKPSGSPVHRIYNIVQHLVSLLCTSLWELNVQRIVPLHSRHTIAQQWCHNKFALHITVDMRDDCFVNAIRVTHWRTLAIIFSQEEEKERYLTRPRYEIFINLIQYS